MITGKPGVRANILQRCHRRSLVWITLAAGVLAVDRFIPESVWNQRYYEGLFPVLRQAYDYSLGWSPIPMLYVWMILILFRTLRWVMAWKTRSFFQQTSRAIGGLSLLVLMFYISWGYNYHQDSIPQRLGLDVHLLDEKAVEEEFEWASAELQHAALALPDRYTEDKAILQAPVNDHILRPDVEAALSLLGLPHAGRVRVRQIWPPGFLLRWSTAGIYIPQTGEGHVDQGLLSIQKPFTIAHEMAHGYGVTDEGACNFVAWVACRDSQHPWVRFGGALTYWRYVAAEMPPDRVSDKMREWPPVVVRALTLIRENDLKYPDLFPRIRNAIYSSYLQHHGVKGGLRSYNEVVRLVYAYRRSDRALPAPE